MSSQAKTVGPLEPGDVLNNQYEIRRVLGKGGMGVVYQAWDKDLDRKVAIKVIHSHLLESEKGEVLYKRFIREAKLMAALNHPNIVTVYNASKADGLNYLVLEFIEGKTLGQVIREKGRLDLKQALAIFIEICKGLQYAHSKSVIHRDIKPANIMLSTKVGVQIMDFGLAKALETMDDETQLTKAGQILGTTHYMAPELIRYQNMDHRGDLFSLGAVMYESITGVTAFDGDGTAAILTAVLKHFPEQPSAIVPDIPRRADETFMRCLDKDPETRYQTARELEKALEQLQIDLGFSSHNVTRKETSHTDETEALPSAQAVLDKLKKKSATEPPGRSAKRTAQQRHDYVTKEDLLDLQASFAKERRMYQLMLVALVMAVVGLVIVLAM